MIRKWSYLTKPFYNSELPNWKNNYFMWRFRFLSLRRKSIKIRKKRLSLRLITKFKKRRNRIKKMHYRSPLFFKLYIFKDWSLGYNSSRQFWRFYQASFCFNTNSTSVPVDCAVSIFHGNYLDLPLNLYSISHSHLNGAWKLSMLKKKSIFKDQMNQQGYYTYLSIYDQNFNLNESYANIGSLVPLLDSTFIETSFLINNGNTFLNVFKNILNVVFDSILNLLLEFYKIFIISLQKIII